MERNISLPGMISVATVQEYFVDNSCEEEQAGLEQIWPNLLRGEQKVTFGEKR